LSVSLLYLREVLLYLAARQIKFYRLADDLAPYLTHPAMPEFHQQIGESEALLSEIGGLARAQGFRLTMHLPIQLALSTPDDVYAERASTEIIARAQLMDAMQIGPEGTLVLHVGGAYDHAAAALERFATRFERLPAHVRRRIAVEPDETCFDLVSLVPLHQMTGVALIFDALHFQLNNPQRLTLPEGLGVALATWPRGVRPKVHFSTQRTEAYLQPGRAYKVHFSTQETADDLQPGRANVDRHIIPPRHGQHADFINPFEFIAFLQAARGLTPFDIMLEAKASDLALLRLRDDLRRFSESALLRDDDTTISRNTLINGPSNPERACNDQQEYADQRAKQS
jgi:UV DNA damage endonuclease